MQQVSHSRSKLLDSNLRGAANASLVHRPSALPTRDDARTFLRDFTAELFREIRPGAKLLWLFSAAFLVSSMLYLGHTTFTRYRAQQQQSVIQAQTLNRRI